MNRREFLKDVAAVAAATTVPFAATDAFGRVRWEIGCFNRPFAKWSLDEGLAGIKAAGYRMTTVAHVPSGNPEYEENSPASPASGR